MDRRSVIALIAVFAFLLPCGCKSSGERLIVPTPFADQFVDLELTCIHATSVNDVVIGGLLTPVDGGVEGILLRTSDAGQTWRRIGSETHEFDGFIPQAIHFNDRRRGWVSGVRARRAETIPAVLRTQDGGGHWFEREIPESRSAVVTNVSELQFENDLDGKVNVVFFPENSDAPSANIYRTRDGGRNWVIEDFASGADEGLTDPAVINFSEKQAYRIGRPLENGTQVLDYTANGGKTWVPVSQFHISQFSQFYGYENDFDAPGRDAEKRREAQRRRQERANPR